VHTPHIGIIGSASTAASIMARLRPIRSDSVPKNRCRRAKRAQIHDDRNIAGRLLAEKAVLCLQEGRIQILRAV